MQIIIIFILALALRLVIAPLGFHVDILSVAGWGQWIYQHGPLGFYDNTTWTYSWPSQPPFVSLLLGFDNWLYVFLLEIFRQTGNIIVKYHLAPGHMLWWFNFTKWFDLAKTSGEASFSIGYLTSIKILPILADIALAFVIYKIAKNIKANVSPYTWPLVYLFSPFSWYLSALWGQYDQLGFLPVLIAFILESKKRIPWFTPFLLALGVAIKPTSLILIPLFTYIYFKNKHKAINMLIPTILIIAFFIVTTIVFTNQDLHIFVSQVLYTRIFLKSDSRLSANAFNFWRLFMSYKIQTQQALILFIPAYVWSTIFFIFLNVKAFILLKKITAENVFKALFIVSAGSWIFMTNMLDRYFFAGIVSGLILCIYNRKLLKYWFPLSLIFCLNLYNQWWFPYPLHTLRSVMEWQGGLITLGLSVINVMLVLKMLLLI